MIRKRVVAKKKRKKRTWIICKNSTGNKSRPRDAIEIAVNGMRYCHVAHTMTYRRQAHAKYLFFFLCYHGFQIEVSRVFLFYIWLFRQRHFADILIRDLLDRLRSSHCTTFLFHGK